MVAAQPASYLHGAALAATQPDLFGATTQLLPANPTTLTLADALTDAPNVFAATVDTFTSSLSSKVIGFLVGNLLASLAFGALLQSANALFSPPKSPDAPPATPTAVANEQRARAPTAPVPATASFSRAKRPRAAASSRPRP